MAKQSQRNNLAGYLVRSMIVISMFLYLSVFVGCGMSDFTKHTGPVYLQLNHGSDLQFVRPSTGEIFLMHPTNATPYLIEGALYDDVVYSDSIFSRDNRYFVRAVTHDPKGLWRTPAGDVDVEFGHSWSSVVCSSASDCFVGLHVGGGGSTLSGSSQITYGGTTEK